MRKHLITFVACVAGLLIGTLPSLSGRNLAGEAQAATATAHSSSRFVALPPPTATAESAYTNFLWVLDSTTGDVIAYRIASVTEEGKHKFWMTERLITEEEVIRNRDRK